MQYAAVLLLSRTNWGNGGCGKRIQLDGHCCHCHCSRTCCTSCRFIPMDHRPSVAGWAKVHGRVGFIAPPRTPVPLGRMRSGFLGFTTSPPPPGPVSFQVFPASNLPHTHAHTVWAHRHRGVYDYGFYDTVHLSYMQRVIKVNMTRLIEVRTPRECPCGGTQLQLLLHARCPPTIVMRSSDIKLLIITSYGSVCCN